MSETEPDSGADKAKLALRKASTRARDGVEQVRQKGREVVEATREKGEAVLDDTRDKTMRAAAETNRLFQEHPITAVAAAVAAGAVIGIFLPRLHLTSAAGKLAGRAVKAAAGSQARQKIWSSVRDAGKSVRKTEDDPEA